MKSSGRLVLAVILVGALASPSFAQMALIATTAPLANHAEVTIKAAVEQAIESAMRGAAAMGLPHMHLRQALVLQEAVLVQIEAADTDASDPDATDPTPEPDTDSSSRPERPLL